MDAQSTLQKYTPQDHPFSFFVSHGVSCSMRLPADTIIAEEKLARYLLLPQARGDKSAFLARAGYAMGTIDRLLEDLRTQVLPLEAVLLASNKFGRYYEIRGTLTGHNTKTLAVRTIWMTEHLSGITKFVTLIPDKRRI